MAGSTKGKASRGQSLIQRCGRHKGRKDTSDAKLHKMQQDTDVVKVTKDNAAKSHKDINDSTRHRCRKQQRQKEQKIRRMKMI